MRSLLLISVLGLVVSPSRGESTVPLSWQDCVALAAQRNPDLLSAMRALEAGRAQYRGSYTAVMPRLSLTNSYSDSGRSASSDSSAIWQAQMGASLNVFNPGDWASIRSASAGFQQSKANLKVSSTNVLLNLYRSFSGLLYSQQQIQVADNIRSIWKKDAEMITLRYASGRESKGNKMRTDAQFLQAESDLSQANRDLRVAQQALGQVLGEDRYQALAVTGSWTSEQLPQEPPNLEGLVDGSPRVLAQGAVVEQARASLASAHSPIWPSLSLSYNRGYQAGSEFPTDNPSWTFTGLLSYPLFGGGPTASYYASAAAERNLQKAREDLRSVRNQVRSDLESAWSGLLQAQDQVRVQRAFLEAARQRRSESDVRYESGLMSFEEWQLVVADLVNFEKSFLKSQQNLVLADAQWRFAKGEMLGDQP
jgi:outer membrane protein